jgi:hypothetical protein
MAIATDDAHVFRGAVILLMNDSGVAGFGCATPTDGDSCREITSAAGRDLAGAAPTSTLGASAVHPLGDDEEDSPKKICETNLGAAADLMAKHLAETKEPGEGVPSKVACSQTDGIGDLWVGPNLVPPGACISIYPIPGTEDGGYTTIAPDIADLCCAATGEDSPISKGPGSVLVNGKKTLLECKIQLLRSA